MELIPCTKCGQAVGDYRAACPFCGAPTGRPEGTPPPVEATPAPAESTSSPTSVHTPMRSKAPRRPITRNQWGCMTVVVLVVLGFVGCSLLGNSSDSLKPTDPKDVKTVALINAATDKLTAITQQASAGDTAGAATEWQKVLPIYPRTDNPYVAVLSDDYVDYANAVRYYIMGQMMLPEVEEAQATVEGDLLAME